jgi:hypothetical protein
MGMSEVIPLTVSLVAILAACAVLILRWDYRLYSFRPQVSLRTMLILVAISPAAITWLIPTVRTWFNPPQSTWFVGQRR